MAFAIGTVSNIGAYRWPDRCDLIIDLYFAGDDVGGNDTGQVIVTIDPDADADAIHGAMSEAVIAEATVRGYTVNPGDLTLPVFQKG